MVEYSKKRKIMSPNARENITTNSSPTTTPVNIFDDISWSQMEKPKIMHHNSDISDNSELSYANLYNYESSDGSGYQAAPTAPASPKKVAAAAAVSPAKHRDDANHGAYTFQEKAEIDLLLHIQHCLHLRAQERKTGKSNNDDDLANFILRSIDEYCATKQWMFHVGNEKGEILKTFLKECVEQFMSSGQNRRMILAELGTYCGYSAILLAHALREMAPELKFHLYSTEISPKLVNIANTMIQMTKLSDYITVVLFDPKKESLSKDVFEKHIPDEHQIDFLLMDHAKHKYLDDLKELERFHFLLAGSHVAADNVVVNRIQTYCGHMQRLSKRMIAETRTHHITLSYSDVQDGIELTTYLKDAVMRKAPK
mmetsp:Transcript_25107/g.37942  ORF Transcript_25107/g.37942 Transcript_25107/m.37942 type:complete len:369 (+) Transcript_25107:96-1202(+)